jgi:hypothetical protein
LIPDNSTDNIPTAFVCASVAATLTGGPKNLTTTTYLSSTITPSPQPTHPVSVVGPVNGTAYTEYGCYGGAAAAVVTADLTTMAIVGGVSLDKCADACAGFDYMGLVGGT